MSETVKIGSREYPITGYVWSRTYGHVPRVDLPMMSDQRWQVVALEDRLAHREKYEDSEEVDSVIADLRKWLAEHALAAGECNRRFL